MKLRDELMQRIKGDRKKKPLSGLKPKIGKRPQSASKLGGMVRARARA